MTVRMIVLNGGSSAGKSGIVRCLQAVLPEPWMAGRRPATSPDQSPRRLLAVRDTPARSREP